LPRLVGPESRGKRSCGAQAWVHPKTKCFPDLEREREKARRKKERERERKVPLPLLPSRHVLIGDRDTDVGD